MKTLPKFGFQVIEHTADLALKVDAETLPDIYRFCAMGMFDSIIGLENIKTEISERIMVSGRDLEDLLVRMLSEMLFRFSTKSLIFCEFTVENLSHEQLVVYARGEKYDEARHTVRSEIKAATYHNLAIAPTEHGFSVTVVFDV